MIRIRAKNLWVRRKKMLTRVRVMLFYIDTNRKGEDMEKKHLIEGLIGLSIGIGSAFIMAVAITGGL